jgi:two-component system chemotaxis sensor kinase CheA
MNNSDMSQFVGVFLDEANEVLALLESDVLQLERGSDAPELLQSIFRAAHTLKGSSRSMGFLNVGNLTHEMENVLDELRQGRLAVNTAIVNALLDCLDALSTLIASVATHGNDEDTDGRDIPALVTRLGALLAADAVQAPVITEAATEFVLKPHEEAAAVDAVQTGLLVHRVQVEFEANCLMKGIRLMMVLSALEPVGSLIACSVNEEAMEADTFADVVDLLLAGESAADAIEAAGMSVSEVKSTRAFPWSAPVAGSEVVAAAPVQDAVAAPVAPQSVAVVSAPVATTAAAPATAAAAPSTPSTPITPPAATVRVDVGRLDSLLNLVGELVIDRTQLVRLTTELKNEYPRDLRIAELLEMSHRIARSTTELQDEIMKTRMLPVDGVFQRMPRMVRDLAQKTGKEVEFLVTGGTTEMDRSILEVLADPLIHLLRNSVDHGLEPPEDRLAIGKGREGVVTLDARHERGGIVIEITDDGRGMNPTFLKDSAIKKGILTEAAAAVMADREALNLIFAPGFSTAAVLSDVSGRGVGMDIVRSNLEKVGGRIEIDSVIGKGSRFKIHLPLTLAIVRALLVNADDATYVLPLSSVVETLRLDNCGFTRSTVSGRSVLDLRGRTVPLSNLAKLLDGDMTSTAPASIPEKAHVVVVGIGERQVGLCVDSFAGEQEVVIKSLGTLLGDLPGLSGAAIMGDGRVALVVDSVRAVQAIVESPAPQPAMAGQVSAR